MSNSSETILITGGTGFAGSHLVEHVIEQGYTNVHVTQFSNKALPDLAAFKSVQVHSVDLTDATATQELIKTVQPTQIYHLAAFAFVGKSFEKGASVLSNNILLQVNVLEAVHQFAPQARILLIGSAEEYGVSEKDSEVPITEEHPFRPVNPYAVSKVAQDLLGYAYSKSYGLKIVRVRPFNHIGERQTDEFAVAAFAKQIVMIEKGQQRVLKVGNLSGIRDFTDVKDMVAAYKLVMEKGSVGEVYNIGSGVGTSMQTIVDQLVAQAKKPIPVEIDQTRMRPLDIPTIVANNEKIRKLGWQPTISVAQSLERVLAYWRNTV